MILVFSHTWNMPSNWNGSPAVLYYSFDDSNDFVLMEGPRQIGSVPLVTGKVR